MLSKDLKKKKIIVINKQIIVNAKLVHKIYLLNQKLKILINKKFDKIYIQNKLK